MTVSGITTSPILTEPEKASGQDVAAAVAILKKAQDQLKLEGEAMVRIIEQSAPQEAYKLDAYA